MTTFDDRERAFEAQYARDSDLQFRVGARRNKLLGKWAAEKLGMSGADADDYAASVVAADFEEAGDEDVYRKVKGDLDAKGCEVSEHQLRRAMEDTLVEARQQIMAAM